MTFIFSLQPDLAKSFYMDYRHFGYITKLIPKKNINTGWESHYSGQSPKERKTPGKYTNERGCFLGCCCGFVGFSENATCLNRIPSFRSGPGFEPQILVQNVSLITTFLLGQFCLIFLVRKIKEFCAIFLIRKSRSFVHLFLLRKSRNLICAISLIRKSRSFVQFFLLGKSRNVLCKFSYQQIKEFCPFFPYQENQQILCNISYQEGNQRSFVQFFLLGRK